MGQLHLVDECPVSTSDRAIYMCRSLDGVAYMKFEVGQDDTGSTDVFITSDPRVFRSMMRSFCQYGTEISVTRNGVSHSYQFEV